jgi:hypothetical protein
MKSPIGLADAMGKAHPDAENVARWLDGGETMHEGPKHDRKLAEHMSAAALELRKSGAQGTPFIRPWRMYANEDHPLRRSKELDACSVCGCGISPDVK